MAGVVPGRVATATVLFTDLVGSTAQRVAVGDDAADELVALHDRLLGEAIVGHGGRVIKGTGDGVMAVFAAAADAVGAAVAIQQAAERHNRAHDDRHELSIRIGVSAGDVQFKSGDCQGTPVVVAARLEARSRPGEIWVTDLVRSIAGSRRGFAFEVVGELELKGLEQSVLAHRVLWEPSPDEAETGSAGAAVFAVPLPSGLDVHSPFVGRQAERERLDAWFADVCGDSRRRMVLIAGEPGIGKTALTAQFARAAHAAAAAVFYGRCGEDLGLAYQPWVQVLGSLVEHAPTELLVDHVSVRGGEIARLVPELATRVHVPVVGSADPEAQRSLLFNAVVDVLRRACLAAPVVLVLDDLQWADVPSLQVLRHVVAAELSARLLVVGTYRETELGEPLAQTLAALAREPDVDRLQLHGLDSETLGELVRAIIGGELGLVGSELGDSLVAETDGNPFFVTEILRHLCETGAIYRDEATGRWMSAEFRAQDLPVSVREVVGRRVARLGDATRRALGFASVIGRDFDLEVLADLVGCDADAVVDLLEPALEHAVVLDVTPGRFSFAHALIEHALYDELSPTRRARAHGLVAAALEARLGGDVGARSGELAYHWALASSAHSASKAIAYAIGAGDFALAQLAPDEARRWYGRAVELVDQHAAEDAGARTAALIGLGDAQGQLGDPQYQATLIEAGQQAAALGDTDLLVRAVLATSRGSGGTAWGIFAADVVALIRAALSATQGEVSSRRAKLLAGFAAEQQVLNPGEAFELARQAIELAQRLDDDTTLCWVASRADMARANPANLAERVDFNREVLGAAQRLGDPVLLWFGALTGQVALYEAGELDEADELRVLAGEMGERIGQPYMQWLNAVGDANRAMLAGTLEDFEAHALPRLSDRDGQCPTRSNHDLRGPTRCRPAHARPRRRNHRPTRDSRGRTLRRRTGLSSRARGQLRPTRPGSRG